MLRWIIFILIYILIDIYSIQAVRTLTRNPWVSGAYIALSAGLLGIFIYQVNYGYEQSGMTHSRMYILGTVLAFMIPKLFLVIFMFGEDVIRVFVGLFSKIGGSSESFYMPSRRKFVSTVALGLAAIPFSSLLIGMIRGKYNYKVLQYELAFDDLPKAFDGYRITQISDVHSGSFDNKEKVAYGIDLINQQESDLVLFTGDLVNNKAEEMEPWKELFGQIRATDGVYSVLGNHDYGDYVAWPSQEDKRANLQELKDLQRDMGWNLLLNEHKSIRRGEATIQLIGVENWGAGGFKKAGDLNKACQGVGDDDFKILMSHDPSHWKEEVKSDPRKFHLTLSGHTHGMQFGIEIPGIIKWSPVKYRYEHWAGIYQELGQYINVNRGFGFIGYPGRVGIWPEVSVITLKRREDA